MEPMRYHAFLGAALLLLAWGLSACADRPAAGVRELVPGDDSPPPLIYIPPSSIEATTAGAEAVAVVQIGDILGQPNYAFPTDVTESTPDPTWEPPFEPDLLPFTDYTVEVVDALLADADVWNGASITMRVEGTAPTAWVKDERFLVVLNMETRLPPYDTYVVKGGWLGAFPLEGQQTTYLGGTIVPFAAGMTPSEFVEAVRAVVN